MQGQFSRDKIQMQESRLFISDGGKQFRKWRLGVGVATEKSGAVWAGKDRGFRTRGRQTRARGRVPAAGGRAA